MIVVFIFGPAAAGKHTIGSIVAERLGFRLFHNHLTVDLVKALFDFGTPPFRQLRADIWQSSFKACADADRSFVFTFHPEATVDRSLIDELVGIVVAAGGSVLFVELLCSRAAILDRLQNESRKQFGKLTDPNFYASIEAQGGFDFPDMPAPHLRIDTELLQPLEAAEVIVDATKSKAAGLGRKLAAKEH